MGTVSLKRFTSSQTRTCQYCIKVYNVKGITAHEKSCSRKVRALEKDVAFEKSLRNKANKISAIEDESAGHGAAGALDKDDVGNVIGIAPRAIPLADAGFTTEISNNENDTANTSGSEADPDNGFEVRVHDIRTEYHPHSRRQPETHHFEDYKPRSTASTNPVDGAPWNPFRSRADFEFAEIAFKGALNAEQTEALIQLIHKVASGEVKFTLTGLKDLNDTWTLASKLLTPFEKKTYTVPYNGQDRQYEVYFRPLWDWTLDLLNNDQLKHHFVWDAQRLFKYNGEYYVRFYHEPWTGERFWQIQDSLPSDGSPLAYIIYCDKSNLSSFGTEKGYPVIARIANLPVDIRNGDGMGGGRVVGWLPTVFEDLEEDGRTSYAEHKRVVWHEAMALLLESIKDLLEIGFWFKCADNKKRRLFPCIMILSADYEEQCIMALNRGPKGLASCPV